MNSNQINIPIIDDISKLKVKNPIQYDIIQFLFYFIFISFLLYLFLLGEKPGFLSFKNYYYIFFMAILPSILLGFGNNYFDFYIQKYIIEKLNKYIDSFVSFYLSKDGSGLSTLSENEKKSTISDIKMILLNTFALAISLFFSNFIKLIIDKGFNKKQETVSTISQNYHSMRQNIFISFVGIMVGSILYMILFFFYKKKEETQSLKKINEEL
jgi:hypothetical protein